MAADLTTLKQIKYDTDTKKFLKEASAMIELVNLVDNYRLRNTKLRECCEHNETHRHYKSRGRHRRAGADDAPRLRRNGRAVRRKTPHPLKPDLGNSFALSCNKPKTIPKCQVEIIKPKIDKEIKLEILKPKIGKSRGDKKHSQKRSRPKKLKNASARTVKREVRQMLSSNLDMTNVRIQSLKDLFGLNEKKMSRKPIVSPPKTDNSKRSSRNRKCNSSDSFLNKNAAKESTKKDRHSKKTVIKKPSLHLMLNLTLKPNSNTIKMQIESKIKTTKSCKSSEPNVLNIHFPSKSGSCGHLERMSKILKNKNSNLSTSNNKRGTRCVRRSSIDQMMKQRDTRHPYVQLPYNKTQAVYNVYDVVPYQQPRQVQGIKSHMSFSLNFGNPPPAEQTPDTDGTRSINTQYGTHVGKPCQVRYKNKINYQGGLTSLQQSLLLGRRNPPSESYPSYYPSDLSTQPCDCVPMECVPDVSDDQKICETCCQAPITPVSEPIDVLEHCLTLFKRTKRRIVERVTNVSREASSIALNPGAFMSRLYGKYKVINDRAEQRLNKSVEQRLNNSVEQRLNNRVEQRLNNTVEQRLNNTVEVSLKDQGSCTCSPFLDTDHVSVFEENVGPGCSFFKRCFGSLLYDDKCAVCTQQKPIGKGEFQCTPGICEKAGLITRLTIFIEKYKRKCEMKKCKNENKKLKDKLKKTKEIAKKNAKKAKKKAEAAKQKAVEKAKNKKKGSPVCRFLTSIFKKDDDKRKLLTKGKKGRKHADGGVKGVKGGKGAAGAGVEQTAKKGLTAGRRHLRRAAGRIKERYYRNKKLAEEQKGRYACDFYLLSLRNRPCLWVYYMCPWCYPHCLQALNFWRQVSDLLLFFVAIIVWSPCILAAECLKVMACNMCV